MAEEEKTLIVEIQNGKDRKITIPADWTITFGPIGVGARNHGESTNVLRFYADASKKQLKAVFRNVICFHEEGIQIREKVVRKKNKTFKRQEKNGEQSYQAEVRQTTWRDPYGDEDEANDFDLSEEALKIAAPIEPEDF